jgi:hypothetical protein
MRYDFADMLAFNTDEKGCARAGAEELPKDVETAPIARACVVTGTRQLEAKGTERVSPVLR